MTDYGKPIAMWCLRCSHVGPECEVPAEHRCIPVFAPIPEGQRPEAEEPDEDTVTVANADRAGMAVIRGPERGETWRPDSAFTFADVVVSAFDGVLP